MPLAYRSMNDFIKGSLIFLGGAAVGAAVALLLSPKTGEQTRQQLLDLAESAKKRAEDYCAQVKEQINNAAPNADNTTPTASAAPTPSTDNTENTSLA